MSAAGRRSQLLEVAETVIARDGAAASMQSIADEAGVNKALLYRHFEDKSALFAALAAEQTGRLLEAMRLALLGKADTRTRTAAAFDSYLCYIETHAAGYRLMTRAASREAVEASSVIADFAEQLGDALAVLIAKDFQLQTAREQALALTWAHGIVGMVQSAAEVWLNRRHVTRATLVDQLISLLWGDYRTFTEHFDSRRDADPNLGVASLRFTGAPNSHLH
jgi:AcrR family transcriptional regulator